MIEENIIEVLLEYDEVPIVYVISSLNNEVNVKWWADKDSWLIFQPTSIQDVKDFINKPCQSPFAGIIKNNQITLQKNDEYSVIPLNEMQIIKDLIPCCS